MKRIPFLVAFALLGSAVAQAAAPAGLFPGIPAQYDVTILALIGYVSGLLVNPLTALAKSLSGGKITGVKTVVISGALSALIAGVAGYFSGLYGPGLPGVVNALLATVTAILTANGLYAMKVQSAKKGVEQAFNFSSSDLVCSDCDSDGVCTKNCQGGLQPVFGNVNLEIEHGPWTPEQIDAAKREVAKAAGQVKP